MEVQPPLKFIAPAFNPIALRIAKIILPVWLKTQTNITHVDVEHLDRLVQLYQQFQAGKIRFLLAFRHPSTKDPFCMAELLWRQVTQRGKRQGVAFKAPVHAHFLYDRGIPLWAGQSVGQLFSWLGGSSIQRGKLDREGLRSARQLFAQAPFPLAAAPEGGTNGHSEIISPLEPGIAQLGFWCVDDLRKANRSEQVLIVPIGIQYQYVTPPWQAIAQLVIQLEQDVGLPSQTPGETKEFLCDGDPAPQLYPRLFRLGESLLTSLEQFYHTYYRQDIIPENHETIPENPSSSLDSNAQLAARLQRLLNTALHVSEQFFGIQAKGTLIDRCRRLEQAGWDYIYREDIGSDDPLAPVERSLANHIAEEAHLHLWHMRIVESFVAVTGQYVREKPTAERFAETVLLLWDLVARLQGNRDTQRPQLGPQQVQMSIGEPLSVSQQWPNYQKSRRQAINQLTQELYDALVAISPTSTTEH